MIGGYVIGRYIVASWTAASAAYSIPLVSIAANIKN